MFVVVPPGRDRTQNTKEENDMKGTTKPKRFGIAATVLITALLIGVVFASALVETVRRNQISL